MIITGALLLLFHFLLFLCLFSIYNISKFVDMIDIPRLSVLAPDTNPARLMRSGGSCNVVRPRPGDVPTSYQPVIIIKNKFFIFCFILIDESVTARQTDGSY